MRNFQKYPDTPWIKPLKSGKQPKKMMVMIKLRKKLLQPFAVKNLLKAKIKSIEKVRKLLGFFGSLRLQQDVKAAMLDNKDKCYLGNI